MERVVYDKIEEYLVLHELYELQCGFRVAHYTDTCLTDLGDYIKRESENGNFTGIFLLDLQKALTQ